MQFFLLHFLSNLLRIRFTSLKPITTLVQNGVIITGIWVPTLMNDG